MYSAMTRMSATAMPVRMRLMGLSRWSLCVRMMMLKTLVMMPKALTTRER